MKIAYIVNQYPKVSHSFIRREIRALERQGIEVVRISMRGWDAEVVDADDRHERAVTQYVLQRGAPLLLGAVVATLLQLPLRSWRALQLALRTGWASDRGLIYHAIYWAEACVVARMARAQGVSHLHAHFGTNPADVAMLAAEIARLPFSFTVHGPEEFDRPLTIGLPEKIRRAAFVVAISSYGRSQLLRWCDHLHWPRIQVVHCGLEIADWTATANDGPAPRRFVCVGRLCEQKGQLLLLAALQRVVTDGCHCELVLAGDGELRAEIEALIGRLGLTAHVRITGWLSAAQVRDEIKAARALVLASFAEGLPVVLMEAMALGRPVLSTFVAGIPELVVAGETGWLFPAGDVEATAAAMRDCLDASPQTLAQMGQSASARARARHDVDAEASRLARLFKSGVAATDASSPQSHS